MSVRFNRRLFIRTATLGATAAALAPARAAEVESSRVPQSELEEMTIAQLQSDLQLGRFSSRSLVEAGHSRPPALAGTICEGGRMRAAGAGETLATRISQTV